MKKVILGAVSALAISYSAFAADIYRGEAVSYKDVPVHVAPHIWTGFYVGANAGYGWSDKEDGDITVSRTSGVSGGGYPASGTFSSDLDGYFGGAQIGYNLQRGKVVFGVEADIQAADLEATETDKRVFSPAFSGTFDSELNVDWFGTVRARLGLAEEKALFYVTGGLAYGGVDFAGSYSNVGTVRLNSDETEVGFAVGGGVEVALDSRWSLKAEYLYVDLGEIDAKATFPAVGTVTEIYEAEADVAFHAVRVGLNYKLGSKHEPLK